MTPDFELQQHGERALLVGLDAAICGTANDCTAFFAGTPVAEGSQILSQWCTYTTDAAAGSAWEITRRGLYHVDFRALSAFDGFTTAGVSLDAPSSSLGRDPNILLAGIECYDTVLLDSELGFATMVKCDCIIRVPQTLAQAAGQGIIRCHLGNGSNGTPNSIQVVDAYCAITRVADLNDLA